MKEEIKKRLPINFNNYYEPFVGAGAIFMEIKNNKTIISDINTELIETYKAIRDNPKELIKNLDKHEKEHLKNPEEYFYYIRSLDRGKEWEKQNYILKAARLIYLNKTCFNGLYRLNNSGHFNVPFNKKIKVNLYNKQNLISLSRFLKNNVKILNNDFEEVSKQAKKGDFIFFDPPYDLLNEKTFDKYNKNNFGVEGQKRLAATARKLKEKGCYVMITNHNTELINYLYKDFTIEIIPVRRSINPNGKKRKGEEIIIYSYNINDYE